MAPRPDTEEINELIEEETGYHWTVKTDEPDKLSFVASHLRFDIIWNGDYWTLELYDLASSYGEEEPRWAQGPLQNATEIRKTIPSFIPPEITHRNSD